MIIANIENHGKIIALASQNAWGCILVSQCTGIRPSERADYCGQGAGGCILASQYNDFAMFSRFAMITPLLYIWARVSNDKYCLLQKH